jgi:putative OPT family oligopeptide transporter
MKRQMVNIEQLRFPSGIAGAQTLRSLYAEGAEAKKKANALYAAAGFGALVAFLRDNEIAWWPNWLRIPEFPGFFKKLVYFGHPLQEWTLSWENSAIMIAAGALIGLRTGWSMLFGALVNYGVLAPWMHSIGDIVPNKAGMLSYRQIVDWSLWFGASVMVTSGLLTFAFGWRTIGRAFAGLKDIFGGAPAARDPRVEAMDKVEIPGSWFVGGMIVAGAGCIALQVVAFSINWWMGVISVLLTFFLSIVACRATGETDITPIGAMGKITQLTYGILAPASKVAGGAIAAMKINLMTAAVTAGAAGTSADLLTGLKTGYLLGANPRKQFLAQFLGIFAGAAIIVPAFFLLVPTPDILGSDKFPAPSAQVWRGVAELLSQGLSVLSLTKRWCLAIGGFTGIILACLDKFVPAKYRMYYPSAMGIGLAFVIPFFNTLSMFVGALAVWIITKTNEKWADDYVIPIASGAIAGESLTGVALAIATLNFTDIWASVKAGFGFGPAAPPPPVPILPLATPDVAAALTPTP